MKQQILTFLLGIFVAASIAATAVSVTLSQPVVPTKTEVKKFRAMYGLESDIKKYIDGMAAQGYIVKSVAMMDDDTFSKAIVVMEKY